VEEIASWRVSLGWVRDAMCESKCENWPGLRWLCGQVVVVSVDGLIGVCL